MRTRNASPGRGRAELVVSHWPISHFPASSFNHASDKVFCFLMLTSVGTSPSPSLGISQMGNKLPILFAGIL